MEMTDKSTITPISHLPPWHVICNTTFARLEVSISTCVQMATLTLHPNDVLTARGERPKPEKSVENAVVRLILGLSSATTTQFLTQVRFTPLDWKKENKKTIFKHWYNFKYFRSLRALEIWRRLRCHLKLRGIINWHWAPHQFLKELDRVLFSKIYHSHCWKQNISPNY